MNKINYIFGLCLPLLFTVYSQGFVDNIDPGDLIRIIDNFGELCPYVDFRMCSRSFESYERIGKKKAKKETGQHSKLILDKFKCCGASSVFKCARDQIKKCVSSETQYELGKRLEGKAKLLEQGKCSRYKIGTPVCNPDAQIPTESLLFENIQQVTLVTQVAQEKQISETTPLKHTSTLALTMNAPQTAMLIATNSLGDENNMDPGKLIEIIDKFGEACPHQQAGFMRCTGLFRSYEAMGSRKAAKKEGYVKQTILDKFKCCGASSVFNCARGEIKQCFSPEVQNELGLKLEENAKLLEQGKCSKYKFGSHECSLDGKKPTNPVLFDKITPLTPVIDDSQVSLGKNTLPLTQDRSDLNLDINKDFPKVTTSNISQSAWNKNTSTLVVGSTKLTLILLIITYLSNKLF